ncbi:hypothetical protein [Agrobacterium vitis]|nr:hypothetical protein [Agrobacterium vitis]
MSLDLPSEILTLASSLPGRVLFLMDTVGVAGSFAASAHVAHAAHAA